MENLRTSPNEKIKAISEYVKKTYLSRTQQEYMKKAAQTILYEPKAYLEEDEKYISEIIHDCLKDSILQILEQSKAFGKYDLYTEMQARQFRMMGLPNFVEKNANLLENSHLLDSLPVDDLFVLHTFWLNHYNKELNSHSKGVFAALSLDLLPQIAQKQNPKKILSNINKDELENTLKKYSLLYYPTEKFINKRQIQISNDDIQNIEGYEDVPGKNFVTFSYAPLARDAKQKMGEDYKNYFSKIFPNSKNNIYEEISYFAALCNPLISSYSLKDISLQAISTRFEHFKNAGIILEKTSKDGTTENFKNFVQFGIDAPFTFPIRQHIHYDNIKDFILNYTGHTKLPVYEGNSDFVGIDGNYMTSQLVLPYSTNQLEYLKQTCKKNKFPAHSKKFVQHLYFLKDTNRLPDHFINPATLGTRKKQPNPKRYVDLEDGKIYTKNEHGEFIPVTPKQSPVTEQKGGEQYGE